MGIRTRRARSHSKTHITGFGVAGVFGFIALLIAALALSLGAVVSTWLEDLPDYTSADAYLVAEPTRVFDANGTEIASYYLQNRRSVDLPDISDYVLKGTVDTEDKRFRQHNGVDPQGILRAAVGQVMGSSDSSGGGSTITQQLVRNTVLSDEQFEYSLKRKVREAYIAIQMEKEYTKDQILNMYLNTIYYGNGAYGIEAASITYFNKDARDLTLTEAATLVGLPNGPGLFDPITNPDACLARRNLVLQRMLEAGDITEEECANAQAEDLNLDLGTLSDTVGTYPYFTDYVKSILLQDFSSDTVLQGGLKVYTTIDPFYQDAAESAVNERIASANNDKIAGALVSIDNTNGYVVAMVGGQNYGTDTDAGQSTFNLATSAQRQAGSSFKTFTLVAAMLDGMSPSVMLNCSSPMQITSTWSPHNYNNNQYGIITLDRATQLSSNTAYGQVIETIGVDKLISTAKLMGIDSTVNPYDSSTLGSSEVTVLEMAEAYSTLAMGGVHRDAVIITKIEDRNGNVVYEHSDDGRQVIDSAVASDATEVLEHVIDAGYTTDYVHAHFSANQPVAGKTGTSDEADNLWFCGFTPQITTAVWVGNMAEGTSRVYYRGSTATTSTTSQPIWTTYMNTVLSGVARGAFPTSDHKATYKANSSWTFVGTSQAVNTSGGSATTTPPTQETQEETTTTTTTTEEPTTPTTPTTPPTPPTPTTPDSDNSDGDGSGNAESPGNDSPADKESDTGARTPSAGA